MYFLYDYLYTMSYSSQYHVLLVRLLIYNVLYQSIPCTACTTTYIQCLTAVNTMYCLYDYLYTMSYSSQYHVLLVRLLIYNVLQQSIPCTACTTTYIQCLIAVNIMYFLYDYLYTMSYSSQYHVLLVLLLIYNVLQQ